MLRKTMCAAGAMMLHKVQIAGRDAAIQSGYPLRLIVEKASDALGEKLKLSQRVFILPQLRAKRATSLAIGKLH